MQNMLIAGREENDMSRIDDLRVELGGAHPRAVDKVKDYLTPTVCGFIRHSPFAVMASSDQAGNCDASPKGGLPGFIKVLDDRTLLLPDVGGNRLFQSFQNFESNAKVGLLFMIPGLDATARVNGRTEVIERGALDQRGIEPELLNPDANSGLIQGLLIHVDEAYFHCPRSFRFAELWNTERIATNSNMSIKDLADQS